MNSRETKVRNMETILKRNKETARQFIKQSNLEKFLSHAVCNNNNDTETGNIDNYLNATEVKKIK